RASPAVEYLHIGAMSDIPVVGVTPKPTISKEEDRRLKLQQWKESKAALEKKLTPAERKAAPDRRAQFFERRERRLQEEREKRASRSGKENNMPPAEASRKVSGSDQTHRLSSTLRPGPASDGEIKLTETTPASAARQPRAKQATATPSSAPGRAPKAPTNAATAVAGGGGGMAGGGG
ncbi:unnamed protein product, partial [Ectocarpus sp. 12 AP-2014]